MDSEAPAVTTETTPEKAGKGARVAAVLAALVLAFLAAVAIVATVGIMDLTPCADVTSAAQLTADGECFDGSSAKKIASLVFAWPGAILAVLAFLLTLGFVVRGRGGRTAIKVTVAAAVIFGLGILIGSL